MARLPDLFGDRGKWGQVLLDFLDVSHNEDGTLRPEAIGDARLHLYRALDLWDEFNPEGGGVSWEAMSYDDWMAGVDARFATAVTSGRVTRMDLGPSSNPERNIYAFEAGEGWIDVLLCAGTHGAETAGQYAAMRWFEQFVFSNHLSYHLLRRVFRVTWIPTLNPAGYRLGRKNANGVDINRNQDVFWERYDDTDPESQTYKGPAVQSEPESQALLALFESHDYRVVFDCHNYGSQGETFKIGPNGSHLIGSRPFIFDVYDLWKNVYWVPSGASRADAEYLNINNTQPTVNNFGNWWARHKNGHVDVATVTIECSQNMFGSTGYTAGGHATRKLIQMYAGFIHTVLLAFYMNDGRQTAQPIPFVVSGVRSSNLAIPNNDPMLIPVMWDVEVAVITRDVLDVPVPFAPANVHVTISGQIQSQGTAGRIAIRGLVNGETPSGVWARSISFPAESAHVTPFSIVGTFRVSETSNVDPGFTFAVEADNITGGQPIVTRMGVNILVAPEDDRYATPRLDQF